MKQIKSQALGLVNRALGLFGPGAQRTEFADGELIQQVDVGGLIRRGNTIGNTAGLFTGVIAHTHVGVETHLTRVTPYNIGPIFVVPPYPDPIPDGLDLWLLYATLRRTSGTTQLDGVLTVNVPVQGWGADEAGGQVLGNSDDPVAYWNLAATGVVGFAVGINTQINGPMMMINRRLPNFPATDITLRTTSSADGVLLCQMGLGLFPIGMGQDALG